jgi:UDP-N-acetylmuramate--alanine ligase
LMKRVHIVGIGGAGMSGIAEILLARGVKVSGSDVTLSERTTSLASLGAIITEGHRAENVAEDVDLLVYTSATDLNANPEIDAAKMRGIRIVRRAEFLGELVQQQRTIAVAGTHGKTTTTSMIAAVLLEAKLDPTVVVGGTVAELGGKNARAGSGNLAIVEADEYDRSFLALKPYIAVLTSLEPEHLDIYKELDDLKDAFVQFANHYESEATRGFAVVCIDEPNLRAITPRLEKRMVAYGVSSPEAKYRATNLTYKGAHTSATIWRGSEVIGELELKVPGEHNVKNALAAIAVGELLAIPFETTRRALKKFIGAERRFQILGEAGGVTVVDDYAHHPTEIRATLTAARNTFPGRRIIACFQPHTFTRTRDFADAFGEALAEGADRIFLLDIYPAREQPIAGITSELILKAAKTGDPNKGVELLTLEDLPARIQSVISKGDVVLTLGAGTITEAGPKILSLLSEKSNEDASDSVQSMNGRSKSAKTSISEATKSV